MVELRPCARLTVAHAGARPEGRAAGSVSTEVGSAAGGAGSWSQCGRGGRPSFGTSRFRAVDRHGGRGAAWRRKRTSIVARGQHRAKGAGGRVSVYEKELHALMARGLQGDAAAYRQFLEKLGGLFRAFFRRKLRSHDAAHAEDLVQETLLAVHLHRHSYDTGRPITAWVYAVARYKLIDHFRRTPGSRVFVPVDDVDELFSDDAPDAADPAHDIEALLKHLPEKQSTAIRMVKLQELTAKEASRRMGVSEADVKISIHRGLRKLMGLVGREDAK